jgi:hypothetical protein
MATLFCKWPSNDEASANAYKAECDAEYEAFIANAGFPEPGAIWALVREDKNGNWTVPLFGPPWAHDGVNPITEPSSCAALRVDAVVVETPEWPGEDEA